jgi:cytochrome c-type biogenesis protein CcmH
MRKRILLVILGTILLVAIAVGRMASGGEPVTPTPSAATLDVSHELMSPFCPGLTLAACPSPAAYDLRGEIRSRFEAGESRDVIVADVTRRYGDAILGTPPSRGLGAMVWALPFVVAVVLAGLIRVVLRPDAGDRAAAEAPVPPMAPPHLRARLDDELAELD